MPSPSQYLHGTDTETFNLLQRLYTEAGADLAVPELAYYAVPVVGLLWAGRLLARQASTGVQLTQKQRGVAGAMVVLGYFALSMACAMTVFTMSADSVTTTPKIGHVATVMGVAYPVVVGGFAGYVLD